MRPLLPLRFKTLSLAVATIAFVIAGLIGGYGWALDVAIIQSLAAERLEHPLLVSVAVAITQIGSAEGLLAILFLAAVALATAKRWRDAAALVGIVVGGRLIIELLKLAIDRPRPFFTPYPVEVHSLSFPSGHAGNSMITFLAIALILTPVRWRSIAVAVAIAGSVVIGATRPLLGVHWPSDIVGGWSFGIAWVLAMVALSEGWRSESKA